MAEYIIWNNKIVFRQPVALIYLLHTYTRSSIINATCYLVYYLEILHILETVMEQNYFQFHQQHCKEPIG
jgi:hypothetical protein